MSEEIRMLPLDPFRVVEFCEVAAGPFCGMLLADMGADVIKVERPDGDAMRHWPPLSNGYSENFASLNRNKRSVLLDLKDPEGQRAAQQLALSADVVIENYRPGVMQSLGLDYATLSREKPTLVYGSISAFGQTGPRSREGGFDLTMQAIAGVMSVTGEPDGPPVKCGVPLCDFVSGLYAAYAIASALHQVRRGGRGEHIDVSMLGATLAVAALQTSQYFGTGKDPEKLGSAHPRNAPYQAFRARDGYFAMAAGNDRLWARVTEITGMPDLLNDPRFASTTLRAQNQTALRSLLEQTFATRSAAEWVDAFQQGGVPCGPINRYSEVLADPQVAHLGLVQPMELPSGVRTRTVVAPTLLGGKTLGLRRASPALGEHTAEILAELTETERVA